MVARWRAMARYIDRSWRPCARASPTAASRACRRSGGRSRSSRRSSTRRSSAGRCSTRSRRCDEVDGWSEARDVALREGVALGGRGAIRPAFIRLHDALVLEILPAARPDGEPGMCTVAGGDEGYRHLIRMHTSLDVDAAHAPPHRPRRDRPHRPRDRRAAGRTLGVSSLGLALSTLRADPTLFFASRARCSTRPRPASSVPGRSRRSGSGACRWPHA